MPDTGSTLEGEGSVSPEFGPSAIERIIDLGDVQCRVVEQGTGQPILFVPGGDYTVELYAEQFNLLSDSYRCIAYDPRGAGDTVSLAPPWTMQDFAADCAALIKAMDLAPVCLCGMSMGAQIVLQTAVDYPELLSVAMPIASPPSVLPGFSKDMMDAEIALRQAGITLPLLYQAVHFAAMYYPASALSDPVLWEKIKGELMEQFDERSAEDLIGQWQPCLDFDCRDRLPTCPVKVHMIAFEHDIMTPAVDCQMVAELAKHGTFHVLKDMGHSSMRLHRPTKLAQKIDELLSPQL